jgi:hypothetical protein
MPELTDQEVLNRKQDAEMIRRPHLWPHMVLPLKRTYSGLETAVVRDVRPDGAVLVEENTTLFGPVGDEKPTMRTYLDAEAVVDAGWRVD